MHFKSAACLVLLASAAPLAAQTAVPPQTWIHAGRLIDRPGKPVRGPSTIMVENGRIVAVRDGIVAPDKADIRVIDLTGKTVLPGLIDSHVHLTSDTGGIAAQLDEVTLSPAAPTTSTAASRCSRWARRRASSPSSTSRRARLILHRSINPACAAMRVA